MTTADEDCELCGGEGYTEYQNFKGDYIAEVCECSFSDPDLDDYDIWKDKNEKFMEDEKPRDDDR